PTGTVFIGPPGPAANPAVRNLRPARNRPQIPAAYLLPPGVVGLAGRLGADLSVEPSLLPPLAPPLGVCVEELPPAADDGLFEVLLVLPAPDCSRWQPASASARDVAMIISAFMDPPLKRAILFQQTSGRPAVPSTAHED